MWEPVPPSLPVWHLLFPLGHGLCAGFVSRPGFTLRAVLLGRATVVRVGRPSFHWAGLSVPVPGRGPGDPGRPGASVGRAGASLRVPERRLPGRWCSRQGDRRTGPGGVGVFCTRQRTPVPWTKPLRGDQGEIRRREARVHRARQTVQRGVSIPLRLPLGASCSVPGFPR
jgi:hypothetical protein